MRVLISEQEYYPLASVYGLSDDVSRRGYVINCADIPLEKMEWIRGVMDQFSKVQHYLFREIINLEYDSSDAAEEELKGVVKKWEAGDDQVERAEV